MSGTMMPRLPVRPRASDRATGFGEYVELASDFEDPSPVSAATASGWVNTRDTVAGDTPARAATSRIDILPSSLTETSLEPVSGTVNAVSGIVTGDTRPSAPARPGPRVGSVCAGGAQATRGRVRDDRHELRADCGRCVGLCCVLRPFAASADFAIDKPAGRACPNLGDDFRCGIHDDLRGRGFAGCAVFDCFGAGQAVAQDTFGGRDWRSSAELAEPMFAAFSVMRQVHELLWYLAEALALAAARPLRAELGRAREELGWLRHAGADELSAVEVAGLRDRVNPLLREASELVRAEVPTARGTRPRTTSQRGTDKREADRRGPGLRGADRRGADRRGADLRGADLVGRMLRGADLQGADLRGAYLIGADLRGADLRLADLIGADLRATDLRGADLSTSLFLTQFQVNAARGDRTTRLPPLLRSPGHWPNPSVT